MGDISRLGSEILVNTATVGGQQTPVMALLNGGDFVVVWSDDSQGAGGAQGDTDYTAVKAQLYSAAGAPIGGEILVNTAFQAAQARPVVTAIDGGGFAVAWEDLSQGVGGTSGDSTGKAIKAQLFDAAGVKTGGEILVNTTTIGDQQRPEIVRIDDGFVVVFEDTSATGEDTSSLAIRMDIFDTEGVRQGSESLVNVSTENGQAFPRLAPLENGGFVAIWSDGSGLGGDSSGMSVKARVYGPDGASSDEILVNSATAGSQDDPYVTGLSNGGFIVVWQDPSHSGPPGTDASGSAIRAQIFAADGGKAGGEILVNTQKLGDQIDPLVAEFGGGLVVVWVDDNAIGDGRGSSIKAQLFGLDGARWGGELLVNTATESSQLHPQVVATPDGGFVITWQDSSLGVGGAPGDDSSYAVKAQAFDVSGVKFGGEILVNTATDSAQQNPKVLATGTGFVIAWDDYSQGVGGTTGDPTFIAVKAQVFTYGLPPEVGGLSGSATWFEGDDAVRVVGGATLSDPDSAQLASVTVKIGTGFAAAQDKLTFEGSGATGDIEGQYDGATGVMTLTSSTATLAQFQAAVRAVYYSNTSDAPTGTTRTIEVVAEDDDGNASDPASRTLNITVQNDAPSGVDKLITMNEDAARTLTAADFGFSDADGGSLVAVKITTTPGAGSLTYNGSGVDSGASISIADINAGKLIYRPGANGNGTGYASFTFQVQDDGGTERDGVDTDASPNTITFDVNAVNDLSVIRGLAGSATFEEALNDADAEPVLVSPEITIEDVDSPILASASVTITTNFRAGEDVLGFTNGPGMGDISADYNSNSGVLILSSESGATIAEFEAALRSVTYFNTSQDPYADVRTLVFVVHDGVGVSAGGGRFVYVHETDDTPRGADQAFSTLEDDDHVFGADDFGFSDIDGGTLRGVTITTLPEAGAITLDGTAVTAGQVVARADIDAGKLVFRGPLNVAGDDVASFTFQVMDDLGDDYNGQAVDQSPNTITFSLTPVSDSPTGTSATLSVGQDASRALTVADFGFVDVDGDELVSVKIAATPQHGALTLNGVAVSVGQVIGVADIAAGKLVFVPAPGEYGAAYADFSFQLKDDGDTTQGGYNLDANPDTLTFNVTEAPPEPPKPPATTPTVDGVPVTTTTGTAVDGTTTHTVTIPVVQPGRTDSVGGNNVADIPLVTGGGSTLLSAQVPAGYGLAVSGPSAPQTAGTSLTDLIREIQAHTTSGSSDQTSLTGGGSGFLGALTASTPLLVQTITPTGGGSGVAPLVINGAASAPGDPLTALVIDTRGLPLGSTLQLNNVEFAAVIGSVTVTGGEGSQTVYGDGASQFLFLGADDDELHGGGGTDTVASAGGADRLYGDDGSDSVSGGIGDDIVHGNAGSDTVSGGEGNDIAYGGKDADRVTGEAGNDLIFGDLGDDVLQGNTGQDSLDGGMGADTVHGGQDNDQVTGGDGNDAVLGDAGDDVIQGGLGADTATGGIGGDLIHGGQGDDVIYGEAGNDWLSGDKGSDTLSGGAGADTFHANAQTGLDWVTDFNFAEGDRVLLDLGTTYAVSQGTSGVTIDIAGGAQMVLAGVQLASLGDGWIGLG